MGNMRQDDEGKSKNGEGKQPFAPTAPCRGKRLFAPRGLPPVATEPVRLPPQERSHSNSGLGAGLRRR